MSEFFNFLKEEKRKKKNSGNEKLQESKVAESIDLLLSEKLSDEVDYHVFEVKSEILPAVISVISKPPLSDKYVIVQESNKVFKAKLKNII